jgi:hypothetical protein
MRGHEIGGLHGAQRDDVLVGAAVAHHADRAHRKKNRKRLRNRVVPVAGSGGSFVSRWTRAFAGCCRAARRLAQLVDENRVGATQELRVLAPDFAQDANA